MSLSSTRHYFIYIQTTTAAMAPKRQKITNNIKISRVKDYNSLLLSDVLCPICRSIMTDPVSLPCNHDFCLCCFEDTMKNVNLVCPLCKVRVGSWWRKTKKEGKHVNVELWKVIKEKFPQQVQNKLTGIEEDLSEKPQIIVACPGEIRKEYEIEKQKDDEELLRNRELEVKASEELIKALKEEEDYQKAVREEKLKLDKEIAQKLAAQMLGISPSTSQKKMTLKKLGPMDKYVKKETAIARSQFPEPKHHLNNNFASKEYTCRVLRLDKHERENQMKIPSPILRKKIQQIKRIVEIEAHSDSSDCIESEMRYFKPIDHRMNPPSQGKPPIKIFPRKPDKNLHVKILSPNPSVHFFSSFYQSAFVRTSPKFTSAPPQRIPHKDPCSSLKRSRSDEDEARSPDKKPKGEADSETEQSPIISKCSDTPRRQISSKTIDSNVGSGNSSPLFYGFDNSHAESKKETVRKNGEITEEDEDLEQKWLQEKSDLEFARKLQEDFNRADTMRGSHRATRYAKRQATLEEIVKRPHRVK